MNRDSGIFRNILFSVELWKIVLPVVIAILAWSLQENSKLRWEQYKRKEGRYIQLIQSIRGFYNETPDIQRKQIFIDKLNECWLYAPDEVIIKGYNFIKTIHKDKAATSTESEVKQALGEFIVSLRNDLLSRRIVEKTNLKSKDFWNVGLAKS